MTAPPADDEFPDVELTPAERKRLRAMIEADKRARWFWTTARTWMIWIGAVAVAITTTYGSIRDAIKAMAK